MFKYYIDTIYNYKNALTVVYVKDVNITSYSRR
jgi:hypothetical protein